MPIDPRRLERLDGVLTGVTPETAMRLAKAIEFDRLQGGELPHEEILAVLRPRLREARGGLVQRMPTARRVICSAFEDVLVDRRRSKQRGRIARTSIGPVWRWLTQTLIPEQAPALLQAIAERILGGGADFADKQIDAFNAVASQSILAAIPTFDMTDARVTDVIKALGGADIAADAFDMAQLMVIGAGLRSLRRELKRRTIATVSEDDIIVIRHVWEGLITEQPVAAPYLIFAILGMLERPWEIMRLAGALSRKMDDVLISQTDFGEIGHLLFLDLEDCVATLAATRSSELDAQIVVPALETFANLSTGMVRELGIKRDGLWGKRMMTVRASLADEMDRLLEFAERDLTKSLPMTRRMGLALRARRQPDMSRQPDERRTRRAVEIARLIAGARPHALAGAFAGMLAEIDDKLSEYVRHYTDEMLDLVRESGRDLPPYAASYVELARQMTQILLGAEPTEVLNRRLVAASAPTEDDARVA